MSGLRRAAGALTPESVKRRVARHSRHATRFRDGFGSWQEAAASAGGYDEAAILARVEAATDEVLAGHAAAERDGVALADPQYRWPVVASLALAAARASGRLAVADVGGSLGSTYRQVLPLLDGVAVSWAVVEQPSYVAAGRSRVWPQPTFHDSLDDVPVPPDVVLLSSVLQYLPDPHAMLTAAAATSARMIVIDRTPMHDGPDDIATVQEVAASLGGGSYPAWILSRGRLLDDLRGWHSIAEFPGIEPDIKTTSGQSARWAGLTVVRGS